MKNTNTEGFYRIKYDCNVCEKDELLEVASILGGEV